MSNARIHEQIAAREITPEEGAQLMIEEDRRAAALRQPAWAPRWLWLFATAAIALVFAAFGHRET